MKNFCAKGCWCPVYDNEFMGTMENCQDQKRGEKDRDTSPKKKKNQNLRVRVDDVEVGGVAENERKKVREAKREARRERNKCETE